MKELVQYLRYYGIVQFQSNEKISKGIPAGTMDWPIRLVEVVGVVKVVEVGLSMVWKN
jgi:hypothetical protein